MILHNTQTKKDEELVPIKAGEVGMYTCGPTVYNVPHIGNYRAYITADILKRTLLADGLKVKHVMNITDVDDKTIRDSIKHGESLAVFTEKYTDIFKKELVLLNIQTPEVMPKATDHITQMIEMIETLLEKGFAYKTDDGSVYFDVSKDKNYGRLANIDLDAQKQNALGRMTNDEYDKENAQDFALWKSWVDDDGEVFWDPSTLLGANSPLGKGRPGWHIECSAMSTKYLGNHFDIHTGGIDLIFPHHENEIAQSECATGEHFSNFWVHNEWLLVEGKKMSKSLGNQVTLQSIKEKGVSPLAFRLWILMAHYRTLVNFNWDALVGAETALYRLYEIVNDMENEDGVIDENYYKKFLDYLKNDLDIPRALTVIWAIVKDENLSSKDKYQTLLACDEVLGLGLKDATIHPPEDVLMLVEKREKAREDKDWELSDELRKDIETHGFTVKDTQTGPTIVRLR